MTHPSDHPGAHAARLATLTAPGRDFGSDNRAPMCAAALDALVAANTTPRAASYGEDPWTARATAALAGLLPGATAATWVPTGTVANVVALGALGLGPAACILVAEDAHLRVDEAGAVERAWGTSLVPVPTVAGKLTVAGVSATLDALAANLPFSPDPAVLAITETSETGRVYTPDELAALCEAAHARGLAVHLDGARFANALVAAPGLAEVFGLGVDTLVVGGTKNGLGTTEAVVTADPGLARRVARAAKQLGATTSKHRFLTAPAAGCLEAGCFLEHAAVANAAAARLDTGLEALGVARWRPVEANLVFAELGDATRVDALDAWCHVSAWDQGGLVRLACAWDHTVEDTDRLLAGIAALTPR